MLVELWDVTERRAADAARAEADRLMTLGWKILNGEDRVPVHGESVAVRCTVKMLNVFSAHGDKDKLKTWIGNEGRAPRRVIFNHGDPASAGFLAKMLGENGVAAEVAEFNKPKEI